MRKRCRAIKFSTFQNSQLVSSAYCMGVVFLKLNPSKNKNKSDNRFIGKSALSEEGAKSKSNPGKRYRTVYVSIVGCIR